MQLPVSGQGHKCKCQQDVPELSMHGVAVWSEQPVISGKLAEDFSPLEGTPAFRTPPGEGWLEKLKSCVMALSPLERGSVRGSLIALKGASILGSPRRSTRCWRGSRRLGSRRCSTAAG